MSLTRPPCHPPPASSKQLSTYLVVRKLTVPSTFALNEKLNKAREEVAKLEVKLRQANKESAKLKAGAGSSGDGSGDAGSGGGKKKKKELRIFMDGAFDMMHYGHSNAFRQGKAMGTYLVVGVNSDASIKKCKGPPVMTEEERMTMVRGCKFVDEVLPNCPYVCEGDGMRCMRSSSRWNCQC